jgi:hypothetical protein
MCWYRIIPARFRDQAKELDYLRTQQSFAWVALPFTFSFSCEQIFDGGRSGRYEALGFLALANAELCSWRVLAQNLGQAREHYEPLVGKHASATSP